MHGDGLTRRSRHNSKNKLNGYKQKDRADRPGGSLVARPHRRSPDLATNQKVAGLLGLRRPSVTSRRPRISRMRKRRGCPATDDRRCLVYQLVVLEGRYHEQGEVHAARDVALENGVTYVPTMLPTSILPHYIIVYS